MQSSGAQSTRNCVSCGRTIAWDANVCPFCGHDYRPGAAVQTAKSQSAMPVIGGVLILIASLLYLGGGGLVVAGGSIALVGEAVLCGAAILVLGIIALLGGIFSIQRKYFVIALLGGIFVAPTIIGLIGLILIAVSRHEFTS